MKQLTCEMCGRTDLVKQDGVFVCQTCGVKYSVEEAKKMMIEGTVDVSGSTVIIDRSKELSNLYQVARQALDAEDMRTAKEYYEIILAKAPDEWEASFYFNYTRASERDDFPFVTFDSSCYKPVLLLLKQSKNSIEAKECVLEMQKRVLTLVEKKMAPAFSRESGAPWYSWATGEYGSYAVIEFELGDSIVEIFQNEKWANVIAADAYFGGIKVLEKVRKEAECKWRNKCYQEYLEKLNKLQCSIYSQEHPQEQSEVEALFEAEMEHEKRIRELEEKTKYPDPLPAMVEKREVDRHIEDLKYEEEGAGWWGKSAVEAKITKELQRSVELGEEIKRQEQAIEKAIQAENEEFEPIKEKLDAVKAEIERIGRGIKDETANS